MKNQAVFHQKIDSIRAFQGLTKADIDRHAGILGKAESWDLFRINPLMFARDHQVDPEVCMDFFLHAAKAGLFDFTWNMICPGCGAIIHSHASVNEIKTDAFHCVLCERDIPATLDDMIEVSFSVSEGVERLELGAFADIGSYLRFFFSRNHLSSKEMQDYFSAQTRGTALVAPDAESVMRFEAKPGITYRVISVDNHSVTYLRPAESGGASQVTVTNMAGKMSPGDVLVAPGPVEVRVKNLTKRAVGLLLLAHEIEKQMEIIAAHPSTMAPFVTGKMLLNSQTFRDLFRVQQLMAGLKLNVRALTLLFTDLKGSTELYDKSGDIFAYSLIQKHFAILLHAVKANHGAIVKTMGDAIMASFSSPVDGVRASLQMLKDMDALNAEIKEHGYELGLKVGVHEGSALAVNADDRLDYFGQSVNIAARVQALAKAGEMFLTEPVFASNGVQQLLKQHAFIDEKLKVSLKGVEAPTTVYKLKSAAF